MGDSIQCTRCNVWLSVDEFNTKRDGSFYKQCKTCTIKEKDRHKSKKCRHNMSRYTCVACNGNSLCEHNRVKSTCKECHGGGICDHNNIRSRCKECKGGSICEHDKIRSTCRECEGGGRCEHNRVRKTCKECKGGSICEHNKIRSTCRECKGGSICVHDKIRSSCKECKGGSICEHGSIRYVCILCGGNGICIHETIKTRCKICNPQGHLAYTIRAAVNRALHNNKDNNSVDYLGCSISEYKIYLESMFIEGMTWENHGEWHIDHLIPLLYENPTLEEVKKRLHYTNTHPMWGSENIAKGNKYITKL